MRIPIPFSGGGLITAGHYWNCWLSPWSLIALLLLGKHGSLCSPYVYNDTTKSGALLVNRDESLRSLPGPLGHHHCGMLEHLVTVLGVGEEVEAPHLIFPSGGEAIAFSVFDWIRTITIYKFCVMLGFPFPGLLTREKTSVGYSCVHPLVIPGQLFRSQAWDIWGDKTEGTYHPLILACRLLLSTLQNFLFILHII